MAVIKWLHLFDRLWLQQDFVSTTDRPKAQQTERKIVSVNHRETSLKKVIVNSSTVSHLSKKKTTSNLSLFKYSPTFSLITNSSLA